MKKLYLYGIAGAVIIVIIVIFFSISGEIGEKSPSDSVKIFVPALVKGNISEVKKYASSELLRSMELSWRSVEKAVELLSNRAAKFEFEKIEILEEKRLEREKTGYDAIVRCKIHHSRYNKYGPDIEGIPLLKENGMWKVSSLPSIFLH